MGSLQGTQNEAPAVAEGLPPAPLDLVGFSLIVDDLVFWDGSTCMGVLGGGGPQTLWGYQLARGGAGRVGLAAGVGADLPAGCRAWLQGIGVANENLLVRPGKPTPRAWQLLEADGRRTQVWRTEACPELYAMLRPSFEELPAALRSAAAFHIGVHPERPPLELLQRLHEATHAAPGRRGLLSVEYFVAATQIPAESNLRALLALCDVFSPNEREAWSVVGPGPPAAVAGRLVMLGAKMVALRLGERGALLCCRGDNTMYLVPAFRGAAVCDTTGCGNAFCGAFLAALQTGRGLAEAGAWGCATASLMAECVGVPAALPKELHAATAERVAAVLMGVICAPAATS